MNDSADFPAQAPVSTRVKRHGRGKVETMPVDRLQRLVAIYSIEEVASEFHHGRSTVAKWLHQGKMPKFAGLMCEALERRRGRVQQPVTIVIRPNAEQRELIVKLLKQMSVLHWEIK